MVITPDFGAVVTILDLPAATTLATTAVFEAVQTTDGVVESIRVPLTQLMTTTFGALPASGGSGQLLGKSSGTDFDAAWVDASSFVAANATSGIDVAGSTSLALSLASVAGLSVLGVAAGATAIPAAITGTASLFLGVSAGGTTQFQTINLATAASFTGVLPVLNGGIGTALIATNGVVLGAGTAALTVVAATTSGLFLQATGSSTAPAFALVNLAAATNVTGVLPVANGGSGTSALATNGLVIGAGTAALTVVAATTAGLMLQSQGTAAAPAWVGGMALINTLSPNGVTTVSDTTSLTATYRNYMVTFENVCPATQTTTLQLQVATAGTAFISGGYVSMVAIDVGSGGFVSDTSTTAIILCGNRATTAMQTSTSYGLHGFLKIFNPGATTFRKSMVSELSYLVPGASGTATIANVLGGGYFDANDAITGIAFSFDSGTIQTGTIRIYGLA